MIKTVSILGCGWLGFPLARKLVALGYTVKGSTTSTGKIQVLKNSNIIPFHLTCSDASVNGDHVADFFETHQLFVNIPFKRDLVNPFVYVDQMKAVSDCAKKSGIKKVIFASSISVYPLNNQTAREDDSLEPEDDRTKALLEAEKIFLNDRNFCTTVIRFAGLYGHDREIAHFLRSGRVTSKNGDAPVNLIHLDDCIEIVTAVLEKEYCSEIFNACGDAHPLRKDLYTHAAIAMRVKQPVFNGHAVHQYKIVSNDKIKNVLSYRFIHPGPWGWIDQSVKRNSDGSDRPL